MSPGSYRHGQGLPQDRAAFSVIMASDPARVSCSRTTPAVITEHDPDTVRGPDVCFLQPRTIAAPKSLMRRWLETALDLVVRGLVAEQSPLGDPGQSR